MSRAVYRGSAMTGQRISAASKTFRQLPKISFRKKPRMPILMIPVPFNPVAEISQQHF
jgi:hypothetical protein